MIREKYKIKILFNNPESTGNISDLNWIDFSHEPNLWMQGFRTHEVNCHRKE